MDRPASIFLIDESEPFEDYCSSGIEIFESTIDIDGEGLPLCIGVVEGPARLLDLVPLAQSISDKLVLTMLNHLASNQQYIPCRKGCCACCSYLVALSLPEVFCIQQDLLKLSAKHRQRVLQSAFISAKKILNLEVLKKHNINQAIGTEQISHWYSELDLSCPFLSGGTCSIYEKRPLACREHMVITSPASCKKNGMNDPEIISLPVSVLEALGHLSADLEQTEVEAVILPLALVCKDGNYQQRSQRTWPATVMVKHFIHILETMSRNDAAELAMSR
jgi:Fe-S-cluster containining protein